VKLSLYQFMRAKVNREMGTAM